MKTIALNKTSPFSRRGLSVVDDDLFDYLNQFNWSIMRQRKVTYAIRTDRTTKKMIKMHREIFKLRGVVIPETLQVDHIDRNGLNNVTANLRLVTPEQNRANKANFQKGWIECQTHRKWSTNTVSKYFIARLTANKQTYYAGCFKSREEANVALQLKRKELGIVR